MAFICKNRSSCAIYIFDLYFVRTDLKVIWKASIVDFWIKYFHLICHLILTKINCITLKIHSKVDFKRKSQNIWQQIILCSCTVMQAICVWPKIWTLSGKLSLMLMFICWEKNIYIFRVYHIRIIAKKKWFTRHETDRFLNNHCQECVHPWLFIFYSRGHDRQSSDQNFSSRGHDRQSSEQNNQKLISLQNNGENDKHAHRFADF